MFNERRKTIFDVLAEKIANLPRSARELVERNLADFDKGSCYVATVDQTRACGCGGRDGIVIAVPNYGENAGGIALSHFEHDRPQRFEVLQLSTEEAKQLVNRLGEAIAAAEQFNSSRS